MNSDQCGDYDIRHDISRFCSLPSRISSSEIPSATGETGDRDIYRWYQVADALNGNFYEDETAPEDIDDSLNDVERLLDKLEPVLD